MNNKNKINQLKHVILVLEADKKKQTSQVAKFNLLIARKMESVNRIIAYRAEYEKMNADRICMVVPTLIKNRSGFVKKLEIAIAEEQGTIDKLEQEKQQAMMKVEEINKKIKAILSMSEALQLNERIKMENRESAMMDDLTGQSKSRQSA